MNAKRCDVCGGFYSKNENEYGLEFVELNGWAKLPGANYFDLCDNCVVKVMEILRGKENGKRIERD